MGFLKNKKILITGITNKKSIAYGIAKQLYKEGAKLAFLYHIDNIYYKIKKIAQEFNSKIILKCDVSKDKNIKKFFNNLYQYWKKFDGLIHSIAYAHKNQFYDNYINSITRKEFIKSHNISSYSFVGLIKESKNMLNKNSSIITLTYLGSNKIISNYNVMGLAKASLEANVLYTANSLGPLGIRVNAISCSPVYTISSRNIKNIKNIILKYKKKSPLRKIITIKEIGNVATFLCSDLSSGITGQILYVDGGFNIISIN